MVHPRHRRRAFTLVELLVVIGIIAVLIAVLLPALNRARQQSLKVNCASNLRNCGQALYNYAVNNRGKFPCYTGGLAGGWMWDLTVDTRDALVKFGATRHTLYCPTYKDQDADGLYNYAGIFVGGYAWIGIAHQEALCALKLSKPAGQIPNVSYFDEIKKPAYWKTARAGLGERPSPDLELAADAILSANQNGPPFSVVGGYSVGDFRVHTASHMGKDGFPIGQNTLYLDGHVTWKEFPTSAVKANQIQRADIRARYNPNAGCYFWW